MEKKAGLTFSQRHGMRPVKTMLQLDSMDIDLRNQLWSAMTEFYFSKCGFKLKEHIKTYDLMTALWKNYFKWPIDGLSEYTPFVIKKIRDHYFICNWNEVYDLIDYIANAYEDEETNRGFIDLCNQIFEEEKSAYRFVGKEIRPIIDSGEIEEIEESLSHDYLVPVNEHLKAALRLLSDKTSPDYRNSIKKSISAVEAMCKLITKDSGATLGKALKKIHKSIDIHETLKVAFDKLYGYTSDAQGIRHAMKDAPPDLYYEDAKFILIACSAFINYLVEKSRKAGIEF